MLKYCLTKLLDCFRIHVAPTLFSYAVFCPDCFHMMLIGLFSYAACWNGFVFLHVSLGKPFACSFGLNYTVFLFLVVGDFNFKEIN